MSVLDTCKFGEVATKTDAAIARATFSHYESTEPNVCHGKHSFQLTCSKPLCSQSSTPTMLHIKFDQDWPVYLCV